MGRSGAECGFVDTWVEQMEVSEEESTIALVVGWTWKSKHSGAKTNAGGVQGVEDAAGGALVGGQTGGAVTQHGLHQGFHARHTRLHG